MQSPRERHHEGETSSSKGPEPGSQPGSEGKTCTASPPGSPASTASPISDDTCPICLGNITDKCMANSCQHCFCLVCLKEWSKQKAVCPLCKESFTKIIYEIKSETEFKEWKVPRHEQSHPITNFHAFFVPDRRFFGYRTTNFPGAASLRRQHPGNFGDVIPSGPREPRSAAFNMRGSSFFRLNIYLNNEWVQPIADITGRYRQSSPELYREQPALTHRLVPWVNRELAALVHSTRIGVVLTEIMDLIERYAINSREFRRAVRPHLGNRTNHFVHEFYHFARSPYDMVGHDNAARYVPRYGFNDESSSDSSSTEDSDAVVEVDVRGNPVSSATNRTQQQGSVAAPENVEREEILTQEGSVLISSDESSTNETPRQTNLFVQQTPPQLSPSEDLGHPVSAAFMMNQLVGRARNFLNSINEGASTSLAEESVASRSSAKRTLKTELPSDYDDSDACIIVEEVNKREKTPEIITLDSEEEEERSQLAASMHNKKSRRKHDRESTQGSGRTSNSHSHRERKGKRKPCLNRSNFPVSLSLSCATTSSSSRTSNRDHSYCNVQEVEEVITCNIREQSDQPSSSEDVSHNYKIPKTVQNNKDRPYTLKGYIISSDSESSFQAPQRKKRKHKEKKSKTREPVSVQSPEDTSRGEGCGSSSWQDTNSPAREKCSPLRKRRKDHKSKVKNSSKSHLLASHKKHGRHCASETSSNNWGNSDSVWTPSSSMTERSSSRDRDGQRQDGSSSEYSSNPKSCQAKEKRDGQSSSKSKYLVKRGKHKKKDRYKEKSKKVKKGKHKKKCKSRRSICSLSSDSDSTDESTEEKVNKHKKRRRVKESSSASSSSSSSSPDISVKIKTRQIRYSEHPSTSD